ncbi:M16 family metallopeptidase [Sphingorhabdus lacus]|uniref:Insulinase family protein n=1 Tax=Sphingorhabdus lacus TaxID=392610 RepID=A0A6I6L3M0_9SPHN|nr:M16 family metallopeptidase [Sphingorhabdus lacus]QGY80560.1 insulinase family protein [Sphingorhabdus lacus]
MRKFSQALALAALLLSSTAYAQTAAPVAASAAKPAKQPWLYEGSDVPVDESWTFGVLPNGLRYAVKKNDVPAGQVSIRVRIDAGALHENNEEQGFAHLIEHLSFRGSTFVPDGEAKRIWQRFGVTFGSDSNAQTTPTQTVYKLDLPNATPEKLDESVKIISGMIRNPRISDTALNAERSIVLAELRENSGAQLIYSDALRQHAFQGQRLANRSTIGTPETLHAASAQALNAFHDRWYRPENAVIVMAGDMEPTQLANLVQKYFYDWKGTGPRAPEPEFGDPTPTGTPTRVLVEATLPTTVSIAYLRPWRKVDDTIAYNQQLLVDALALQIINRRLEVQARGGGNFLFAEVAQEDISRTADATLVSVTPVGDRWEAATKDVRAVIADAVATPPSKADIDRELVLFGNALRTMLDSYPFEAAAKQADDIVNAVDIRETVAAPKTVVEVFEGMKDKFTPEWLLASTQALFKADATRLMLSSPAAVANADNRALAALQGPVAANTGARLANNALGFDALPKLGAPGKLVSEETISRLEMTKLELSNGVRGLLYPNKAESGQIRVLVRFGKGYQSVTPTNGRLLWAGPYVLPENGIGRLKRTDIDQMVNGRRIELNFAIDDDAFEFAANTRPDDLADQLTLIATKLEHPGWDTAPVERAKALATSGYDSFEMSATSVLQRDLEYLLRSKDPRWKAAAPAEIAKIDPASFQAYWAPLMSQGPIEVMLFGDFDKATAVAALEKSFGALRPRAPVAVAPAAKTVNFPAPIEAPVRLTHKGSSDQAAAVMAWPTGGGIAGITEGRQLEILAAVFRDRLFEKFRAEQAASYSPDMAASWPKDFTSGGYLMAYTQVKPADVERFFDFANEVAADLSTNPVSADELQRAVEPMKQAVERAASGNTFWLNQLKGATYDPTRFVALGRLYSDYTEVTPDQLQILAKRYFVKEKSWKLVVGPQSGGTAQAVSR